MDHFYLDIPSGIEDVKRAGIYSITGVKVMDIEQSIKQGSVQVIEISVSHLNEGVYFVRIETTNGSLTKRFWNPVNKRLITPQMKQEDVLAGTPSCFIC